MNRRSFLRNLGVFSLVPLFTRIKGTRISHPWYVEEECKECGRKEYIFVPTQGEATTTEWYEREKSCECGGKRDAVIGNVLTDLYPNKDLVIVGNEAYTRESYSMLLRANREGLFEGLSASNGVDLT